MWRKLWKENTWKKYIFELFLLWQVLWHGRFHYFRWLNAKKTLFERTFSNFSSILEGFFKLNAHKTTTKEILPETDFNKNRKENILLGIELKCLFSTVFFLMGETYEYGVVSKVSLISGPHLSKLFFLQQDPGLIAWKLHNRALNRANYFPWVSHLKMVFAGALYSQYKIIFV